MQRAERWILWRLENGKKKPYSAKYDGLASTTKQYTWSTYEKAVIKLKYSDYNGLGYVFAENDGLVFIDLDHCITDAGEISELAEKMLNLFKDTYAEISQSGNGMHIVCKGAIQRAYKSNDIEIYSSGRYMAFTGNAVTLKEPTDCQSQLDLLCKELNITAVKPTKQPEEMQPVHSVKEIINKAESGGNGAEFKNLYYKGIFPYKKSDGKPDQSRADLRLISILVYYGATDSQIHSIFLESKLGERKKAERDDYIQRTIDKARQQPNRNKSNKSSYAGNKRRFSTLSDTPKKIQKINRFNKQ